MSKPKPKKHYIAKTSNCYGSHPTVDGALRSLKKALKESYLKAYTCHIYDVDTGPSYWICEDGVKNEETEEWQKPIAQFRILEEDA